LERHRLSTHSGLSFALKIVTIVSATLIVFFQDLTLIFADALRNGTTSYVLVIPIIFAYLVYRKRKMLGAVMPLSGKEKPWNIRHLASLAGILLATTAVLIYWHGSTTSTPLEYHMFTLPVFAASLCLILFNPQTLRQMAFPIAFLFFLMPLQTEIESVLGFVIFVTLVAYMVRDKLWKKIAFLIAGIPLIYALNMVGINLALFTGYYYSSDLPLQMLRLLSSWTLIFLGTFLLLIAFEKAFKTHIFAEPAEKCLLCNPKKLTNQDYCRGCGRMLRSATAKLHKSDVAKLAAIIILAGLLVTVQTPVFALMQGPPIVAINTPSGQQVSTGILPQTDQYNLTFQYKVTESNPSAGQDMSFVYQYAPLGNSNENIRAILEIAPTSASFYKWENQPKIVQIDLRDIELTQSPQVIGRLFVFNYTVADQTQAVLYWFEAAGFMVNSTSQGENVRISLIAIPQSMDELPNVENQLVTLAKAITNYWQPIKTWSQITLIMSRNGVALSTATATTLAVTIFYFEAETRKRKKASTIAIGKLAVPSREIVKAVQETEKPATLENISKTLRKSVEPRIATGQLEQRLEELEEAGVINGSISSQNDEPTQTWKA
jgi:exosortase/archaeosortase family protein